MTHRHAIERLRKMRDKQRKSLGMVQNVTAIYTIRANIEALEHAMTELECARMRTGEP